MIAAFVVSFSIRKEFLKKKVNGEIAFTLISLFNVQIQEPASRSTTTRAFVFFTKFFIAKNLKQEIHDNLSVFVDKSSACGLSITGDIKIYQYHMIKRKLPVTTPNGEAPMDYQGVTFTAQI